MVASLCQIIPLSLTARTKTITGSFILTLITNINSQITCYTSHSKGLILYVCMNVCAYVCRYEWVYVYIYVCLHACYITEWLHKVKELRYFKELLEAKTELERAKEPWWVWDRHQVQQQKRLLLAGHRDAVAGSNWSCSSEVKRRARPGLVWWKAE